MVKKKYEELMLTEHIFEARHAASGTFLDIRGSVADYIVREKILPHWRIENDFVQFLDSPKGVEKMAANIGYKRAGYEVRNPDTKNFFQDKTTAFWKVLLKNDYYPIPDLQRIGIRTKVFLASHSSFEEVHSALSKSLLNPDLMQKIGGKETDLQVVLDLKEDQFLGRIVLGPLHEKEAGQYFNFKSEHFDRAGIFIDIDYSKKEDLNSEKVPAMISSAMAITWAKIDRIAETIGI